LVSGTVIRRMVRSRPAPLIQEASSGDRSSCMKALLDNRVAYGKSRTNHRVDPPDMPR
jgi:hypothetical protein